MQTPERTRVPVFDRIALAMLFLFLANDVIGGALRYYAVQIGLIWVAYLPGIVIALLLPIMFLHYVLTEGITFTYLILCVLFAVSASYGIVNLGNASQVGFGLWTLLPFLMGVVVLPAFIRSWKRLSPYVLLLWGVAVSGVLINYFHSWPWIGFEYRLGTMQMSASRLWNITQFNMFRLPGFSAASYFVAPQLLLFALFLKETLSRHLWFLVWIVTGIAIALTTSKTLIAIFLVFSLLWICLHERIPHSLKLIPLLMGSLDIVLPFSMLFITVDWLRSIHTPLAEVFVATFVERMQEEWPESIKMIIDHGSRVLGRGLGGIGTAQAHFEPSLFSPSDNIAVYIYATFGLIGLAMLVFYSWKASRAPCHGALDRFFFYTACIVLTVGTTLSIMDSSLLGLAFGASFRYFQERPTSVKASTKRLVRPARKEYGRYSANATDASVQAT